MAKKVILGPKPKPNRAPNAEEWVNGSALHDDPANRAPGSKATSAAPQVLGATGEPDSPAMKRLTIDVPEALHAQIKSRCALKGVKMADEVRALLEAHFGAPAES